MVPETKGFEVSQSAVKKAAFNMRSKKPLFGNSSNVHLLPVLRANIQQIIFSLMGSAELCPYHQYHTNSKVSEAKSNTYLNMVLDREYLID